MAWVECVLDTDYEIFTEYPYDIRRKSNHQIIKEDTHHTGYVYVYLNQIFHYKHEIVAVQFITNDEPLIKTEIDHINRNKNDYHISNLRWVSHSENCKNKTSNNGIEYEWIEDDDLPDDLIEVNDYGTHKFEDYYYSESMDRFMFWNGIKTRILHINYTKNECPFVCALDKDNKLIKIYYSKFKKLYGFR